MELKFIYEDALTGEETIEVKHLKGNEILVDCICGGMVIAFDKYYEDSTGRMLNDTFPYMVLDGALCWNVNYHNVKINDFINTHPQCISNGIYVTVGLPAAGGRGFVGGKKAVKVALMAVMGLTFNNENKYEKLITHFESCEGYYEKNDIIPSDTINAILNEGTVSRLAIDELNSYSLGVGNQISEILYEDVDRAKQLLKSINSSMYVIEEEDLIGHISFFLEVREEAWFGISKDDYNKNLVDFFHSKADDIFHIAFETHFGCGTQMAIKRTFPYIQRDDLEWNVPYDEVTIADFINTFPEIKKYGIHAEANNVAGGFSEIGEILFEWLIYMLPFIEAFNSSLDVIGRIQIIKSMFKSIDLGFCKKKDRKPLPRNIELYILRKNEWNVYKLMKKFNVDYEFLDLVLSKCGYVQKDDNGTYVFSEEHYNKILELCCDNENDFIYNNLSHKIKELNLSIFYAQIMSDDIEQCKKTIEIQVNRELRDYKDVLYWDENANKVFINKKLPPYFDEEYANEIGECIEFLRDNIKNILP